MTKLVLSWLSVSYWLIRLGQRRRLDLTVIFHLAGCLLEKGLRVSNAAVSPDLVAVDTDLSEAEKREVLHDPVAAPNAVNTTSATVDFYEPVEAYSGASNLRPNAVHHRSPTRQRTRSLNLSAVHGGGSPNTQRKLYTGGAGSSATAGPTPSASSHQSHPVYLRSQTMVVHNQGYAGCGVFVSGSATVGPITGGSEDKAAPGGPGGHTVERPAPALPPKKGAAKGNGSRSEFCLNGWGF